MKKELYIKICKRCEKTFRTDKKAAYVCPGCKLERKELCQSQYKKRKNKTAFKVYGSGIANATLSDAIRLIDKYNAEHGTCYTYGQAVMLNSKGDIKL